MIINIPVDSKREALKAYLDLLQRFHKLTVKETEITVEIILAYYYYLDKYKVEEAAVKLYLEKDSRIRIRGELGKMKAQVFNNYVSVLKKKNIIEADLRINKALLPDINKVSLTVNLNYAQEESRQGSDPSTDN